MDRVSYKPLLERFNIPRPTLIEWQKCPKGNEKNWRAKHIEYLREQIEVENETKAELKLKAILPSELFLVCVFMFLTCTKNVPQRGEFKKEFKEFLLNPPKSIEYQHDFAKRVWKDGDERYEDCQRVLFLIDSISSFQYYILARMAIEFNSKLFNNDNLSCSKGLGGKTWQEMHMYDRAFSVKNICEFFKSVL